MQRTITLFKKKKNILIDTVITRNRLDSNKTNLYQFQGRINKKAHYLESIWFCKLKNSISHIWEENNACECMYYAWIVFSAFHWNFSHFKLIIIITDVHSNIPFHIFYHINSILDCALSFQSLIILLLWNKNILLAKLCDSFWLMTNY